MKLRVNGMFWIRLPKELELLFHLALIQTVYLPEISFLMRSGDLNVTVIQEQLMYMLKDFVKSLKAFHLNGLLKLFGVLDINLSLLKVTVNKHINTVQSFDLNSVFYCIFNIC